MSKLSLTLPVVVLLISNTLFVYAAGPKISDMGGGGDNKHNLSSGHSRITGYKASSDDPRGRQICIFCHTPHNASPQTPLWNRNDPTVTFGHYSSSSLVIRKTSAANYGEPTGSSRLCLSCHDGVTAGGISLGNVLSAVRSGSPIPMQSGDKISGDALFTASKIRTGHHPVSFVYDFTVLQAIQSDPLKSGQNYNLPPPGSPVKLDHTSQMQCTTCHDPHQNQSTDDTYPGGRKIAPFWVYGGGGNATDDHDAVCNTCHAFASPSPW
jgi:hypothetical protein